MLRIDKDFLEAAAGQVTRKHKSPVPSILILVGGVILAMLHTFVPALAENADLSSATMIIGWSAAAAGAILLAIALGGHSWQYTYAPTGEKMRQYVLQFEAGARDKVKQYATEGRFDKIAEMSMSTVSAVKVIAYGIPGKEILWAQVFEFVPHNHVPATEIISYAKGACPVPASLK